MFQNSSSGIGGRSGDQTGLRHAYEISYAVFRVAAMNTNLGLKDYLEREALLLLHAATAGDHSLAITAATSLEYFLRFGGDVALLDVRNVEQIISELHGFRSAMAEANVPQVSEPRAVNLEGVFSKKEEKRAPEPMLVKRDIAQVIEDAAEEDGAQGVSGMIRSGIRQSTILEKIRQSGNCRIKDIQELFPECSERTIRYDLQSLAEQNLIEKIGNGGPSVYYRIRQTA